MKKLVSVVVSFLLTLCCLFSLSGCKTVSKITKWYKKSTLTTLSLQNLPKPDFEYSYHDNIYRRIYGTIEEENFTAYVQELFAYMSKKFERLGTPGEALSEGTMFSNPDYAYVACEKKIENYGEEIKSSNGEVFGVSYSFLYFENELKEDSSNWKTDNHVSLTYYSKPMTVQDRDGEKHTVNFSMSLRKQGVATQYIDYERLLVNLYEEAYPEYFGTKLLKFYGLDYDYRYWIVMMSASGVDYTETPWTENVGGYYFHYPNGNRILVANPSAIDSPAFYTLSEAYENGLIYREDLKRLESKHAGFYPEFYELPTDKIVLSDYEPWLKQLTAEDISLVRTKSAAVGVAPGNLKNIQRIRDKSDIVDVLQKYQQVQMTYVSRDEFEVTGGREITVEFVLTDGTVKTFYFNNGNYDGNRAHPELSSLQYFKLDEIPTLENYTSVENAYAFISYKDSFNVETGKLNYVYEYSIDRLEFIEYTGDADFGVYESEITFDGGRLYTCSRDRFFYVGEDGHRKYYQIVGDIDFYNLPLYS